VTTTSATRGITNAPASFMRIGTRRTVSPCEGMRRR
jgi:hypothetical protein